MTLPRVVCALVAYWYTAIALADGKNGTSLAVCNIARLTLVLRCPQGTHACETRCRALMSRGIRSRNSFLARLSEYAVTNAKVTAAVAALITMIADAFQAPPGMVATKYQNCWEYNARVIDNAPS